MSDVIDAEIMRFLRVAGRAGAAVMADKMSREGSGIHYPGLPNRSSAPGEYPAKQSGDLVDSISSMDGPGLSVLIGAVNNPPPHALHLVNLPPSAGGRDFVTLALHDPDVQAALTRGR